MAFRFLPAFVTYRSNRSVQRIRSSLRMAVSIKTFEVRSFIFSSYRSLENLSRTWYNQNIRRNRSTRRDSFGRSALHHLPPPARQNLLLSTACHDKSTKRNVLLEQHPRRRSYHCTLRKLVQFRILIDLLSTTRKST